MLERLDERARRATSASSTRASRELSGLRDEIGKYRDHIAARVDALPAPRAMSRRADAALAPSRAPARRVRVVTAASLFDGHDAAINIMRRLLQAQGAEVIHLGHDRSVEEIAEAAVQEDADAVAVSSLPGRPRRVLPLPRRPPARAAALDTSACTAAAAARSCPRRSRALEAYGVARIFSPEDGRSARPRRHDPRDPRRVRRAAARGELGDALERLAPAEPLAVARVISWFEEHGAERPRRGGGAAPPARRRGAAARRRRSSASPGTGGAGKSSVVDELVRRWRRDHPGRSVGLLLVDPTRRRTGGALLGDRIRMNAIHGARRLRALARDAHARTSRSRATVADALRVLQAAGFDLVLVETAGIGQSDSEIVDLVDLSLYVMTPDYGAPSQLEKIDMLDLADLVVLNKSDRRGAQDALRDVRKQWRRNRGVQASGRRRAAGVRDHRARLERSRGSTRSTRRCSARLGEAPGRAARPGGRRRRCPSSSCRVRARRYLAEIAETRARLAHARPSALAERASDAWGAGARARAAGRGAEPAREAVAAERERALAELDPGAARASSRRGPRSRPATAPRSRSSRCAAGASASRTTASRSPARAIPKVALPRDADWGARVRFLRRENLPGRFPFTAGVFPFKRDDEDPTRMFAGEGGPERTNRRFHLLTARPEGRAALDRLRQRDALRPRSRRAPRRLRQGRQLGRLGLHASTTPRSSTRASTSCAPEHLRLDDDQRPGADRARLLPERRDRPGASSASSARAGSSTPCARASAATPRCRATRRSCRAGHDGPRARAARHPRRPRGRRRDLRADPRRRARAACAARCRPTS